MKKKRNIGQEIIKGLEEFTKVLESGEPLEDHFRVTTIEKVNDWENVITVKGPKYGRKRTGDRDIGKSH